MGRADTTIEAIGKKLRILAKEADLNNPNTVTELIANKQTSTTYKQLLVQAYKHYCTFNKIQWETPKYKPEHKSIRVPTTTKLEMIIANSGKRMATKLTLSKETGMRPTEVVNLKVKDIDQEQHLVYPTTAKHGEARKLKISLTLTAMLQEHITRNNLKPEDKLFNITSRTYSKMYRITRNTLATKLHDPTLKTIRLYDIRHYYATMLYSKTHNILTTMQQLGHKDIKNTIIYTHLIEITEDEYNTATATTIQEAQNS